MYSNGPGTQPEHNKMFPKRVNSDKMLITFDLWAGGHFSDTSAAQNVDVKFLDGNGLPLVGIVKRNLTNIGAYVHFNRTANNFPADVRLTTNTNAFRDNNAWYNIVAVIDKIAATIDVTFTNKATGAAETLSFAYNPARTDGTIAGITIMMGQSGQNTIYYIDNVGVYAITDAPKAELETAITDTLALSQELYWGDYTIASWNGFLDAIVSADAVLADGSASDEDVYAAMAALEAAIANLAPKVLVSAVPSAWVKQLNGNKNELYITILETFCNGTSNVIESGTISINNNAEGTYQVGPYKVFVNTKGNTQIREIYIRW